MDVSLQAAGHPNAASQSIELPSNVEEIIAAATRPHDKAHLLPSVANVTNATTTDSEIEFRAQVHARFNSSSLKSDIVYRNERKEQDSVLGTEERVYQLSVSSTHLVVISASKRLMLMITHSDRADTTLSASIMPG